MQTKHQTPKMPLGKAETDCLSNLALLLREHATLRPNDTAMVAKYYARSKACDYTELSFSDLDTLSDSIAAGLKIKGVQKGEKVMLLVPPGVEFVAIWFALLKIGAICVLIDPGMGGKNLRTCISDVEPDVLISIPIVHALACVYRGVFASVKLSISVGRGFHFGALPYTSLLESIKEPLALAELSPEETVAITFTTGSTGVPKGVRCTQRIFVTQLQRLQESFEISESDVGFPAFLPFALFCIALGSKAVMPDINPRRPADADPQKMYQLLETHHVTYSFGSPAFWAPLAAYCSTQQLKLSLDRIIMFGAPISLELHQSIHQLFDGAGDTYTPYGATEALPIANISGSDVIAETGERTRQGAGVCVGKVVADTEIRIIPICDQAIETLDQTSFLPLLEIGEIIVAGGQVSAEYLNRPEQTANAKIVEGDKVWHRMGDVGYFDSQQRLWFCGRKNHRVQTASETLFTVPCESVFNQHPAVLRSALVGVGPERNQTPVICIELRQAAAHQQQQVAKELLELAEHYPHCKSIRRVLFHKNFPVDFRHNAKIIREELQRWATKQLENS